MKFVDFLRRYHIAPLKYDDGRVLVEKDYFDFYSILSKYFKMKELVNKEKVNPVNEDAVKSVGFSIRNSLISPDEVDVMDKLMGFDSNLVVEET